MGFRVVVLSIAALAACGSEKNTHLRLHVAPHVWGSMDVCSHGDFTVYAQTESGATVRIPGIVHETAVGDNHAIALPADKLGDRTSLTMFAEHEGRKGEATFEIPKPPPRRGKIEGKRDHDRGVISGMGEVVYAPENRHPITVDGVLDDAGMLTFTYTGCLLASGTAGAGTVEVKSPTELIHRIPLATALEQAGPRDAYGHRPLAVTLQLTNADGVKADVTLEGSLAVDGIERGRFAASEQGGALPSAPAYEKGKKQAFAQFVSSDDPIVHRGTADQVAAVAWSTWGPPRLADSCGPYSRPGGYENSYVRRDYHDEKVTIREAKTGAVIAEKTFKGVVPPCPTSVLKGGALETDKVTGGASTKAMLAWIAATVR